MDTVNSIYDYVNLRWPLTHVVGMARIMTCARGVATLLSGGTWEDTGLPECFKPTSERIVKNELQVRAEWTLDGVPES